VSERARAVAPLREPAISLRFVSFRPNVGETTAPFRKVKEDNLNGHRDALEFPSGEIVLLTRLCEGQHATVLQLPATPRVVKEADEHKTVGQVQDHRGVAVPVTRARVLVLDPFERAAVTVGTSRLSEMRTAPGWTPEPLPFKKEMPCRVARRARLVEHGARRMD
jgi:hypothetical protein